MARILVVEDEMIIAQDIKKMLENHDYHVIGIAVSGKNAIKLAKESCPDLILMDIHLKGDQDGIDTVLAIHEFMDVPVIYLTAFYDNMLIERAMKTHSYGYIIKPFKEVEIYYLINMALFKHGMEKKLKISNEKYYNLFEQSNDAVFIYTIEGTILDINKKACNLLGYQKNELYQMNISQLHSEEDSWVLKYSFHTMRRAGAVRFETQLKRKNGSLIDVEISARFFDERKQNIQGIVRDITERKQVEANIRNLNMILEDKVRERTKRLQEANQSLQKFSLVIEHSPVIVIIIDRNSVVEYVNPKYINVTGYSSKEVIGKKISLLNASNKHEKIYADLWNKILKGEEWHGDLCDQSKNKNIIWLHTSISPIIDDDFEITHFVLISEDVTEKRNIDEKIKKYMEEMEQFNKSMVDREMRIIELKTDVNDLLRELGKPIKYKKIWNGENMFPLKKNKGRKAEHN